MDKFERKNEDAYDAKNHTFFSFTATLQGLAYTN